MLPLDAQFLVGPEVVGRGQQGDDTVEALLAYPDDLFLTSHPPVGAGVPTGPLADRQAVFDDPREVPGRDPSRPLALHVDSPFTRPPAGPPAPWGGRRAPGPWPRPCRSPTRRRRANLRDGRRQRHCP